MSVRGRRCCRAVEHREQAAERRQGHHRKRLDRHDRIAGAAAHAEIHRLQRAAAGAGHPAATPRAPLARGAGRRGRPARTRSPRPPRARPRLPVDPCPARLVRRDPSLLREVLRGTHRTILREPRSGEPYPDTAPRRLLDHGPVGRCARVWFRRARGGGRLLRSRRRQAGHRHEADEVIAEIVPLPLAPPEERALLAGFAFLSLRPLLVELNVPETAAAAPLPDEVAARARAEGAEAMALWRGSRPRSPSSSPPTGTRSSPTWASPRAPAPASSAPATRSST